MFYNLFLIIKKDLEKINNNKNILFTYNNYKNNNFEDELYWIFI